MAGHRASEGARCPRLHPCISCARKGPITRWADEERLQTARGYTLYDFGARYRYKLGGRTFLDAFVNIENILNVDWREAQFSTTSRLRGEPPQGVTDINYTPGNPRTVVGGLALRF